MSITWIKQPAGEPFIAKSAEGYYGVVKGAGLAHGDFTAFHIEALWASPTELGVGSDLELAKLICEQHRAGSPA
jgi:hypothetical protein